MCVCVHCTANYKGERKQVMCGWVRGGLEYVYRWVRDPEEDGVCVCGCVCPQLKQHVTQSCWVNMGWEREHQAHSQSKVCVCVCFVNCEQ